MAKDKKINLLFDATVLSAQRRSGIYNVAYELLQKFQKDDEFNLKLYCSSNQLVLLKKNLKGELAHFSSLPLLNETNYNPFIAREEYLYFKYQKACEKNKFIKKYIIISKKLINHFLLNLCNLMKKNYFLSELKDTDVFFSPCFKIPEIINQQAQIKKIVILYDAIPLVLQEYKVDNKHWFSQLCQSLNINDTYFAISEYTKNDFIKYFPFLKQAAIHVIPLATSNNVSKTMIQDFRKAYNLPTSQHYILTICNAEPRKNLNMMINSFVDFIKKDKIKDLVFLIGGHNQKKLEKDILEYGEYAQYIKPIGYVEDCYLAQLYSNAEWFVYTSQYEGFGMPPLEAMSCGSPVITGNNSSLPEVVGNAGLMIDSNSKQDHITAYEKYYFDEDFRKEMSAKALNHARQFSWEKTYKIIKNNIKDTINEVNYED